MRIYLPATLAELTGPDLSPRLVHAVTDALRQALPDEDDEGLEYAAQLLASDDSLDLLGDQDQQRRCVVAADVPQERVRAVEEPHAPSVVELTVPVAWDTVACAHVDEDAAGADVVAARAGDGPAAERLAERDLLWYDVSELGTLARP
ncbi:DUF6912 family protein [Cellulomonas bogoriensis]|uniref:Mucin n=1 Tax=Cellulomonas bogoriensis 69B4 = DSM 16987 TaxID=1386082 RepID=A0A0A0C2A1_9CELL|nr:hypothetical protein [Cellulomonas bogoriensis]KGM13524.1 mucin [Cellulomonas bogoriensis 69B4 = DSM 16987]